MKLYSFASSSTGNCYLYVFGDTKILVDVGISRKKLIEKLKDINLTIDEIDEVILTHEHSDHIKGLEVLVKNHNPIINITKGTYGALSHKIDNINIVKANKEIKIQDVKIEPLEVSHDAKEPIGMVFEYQNQKFAHILDTGYLPRKIKEKINDLHFYVLESNYEEQALLTNPKYPFNIKKRINSDIGHLSNKQASQYIKELVGDNTKIVCFGHLSEKNNSIDLVDIMNDTLTGVQKYILQKDKTMEIICK
ncbi:MAG: MBL fold metallo-hydrolase [Mycoplasmatales bacterium]